MSLDGCVEMAFLIVLLVGNPWLLYYFDKKKRCFISVWDGFLTCCCRGKRRLQIHMINVEELSKWNLCHRLFYTIYFFRSLSCQVYMCTCSRAFHYIYFTHISNWRQLSWITATKQYMSVVIASLLVLISISHNACMIKLATNMNFVYFCCFSQYYEHMNR